MYSRGKLFFIETFTSANDVIQMDDPESHMLIGKGYSVIQVGLKYQLPIQMYYTLKIETKEDLYRYQFYDIYFQSQGTNSYPEYMFQKKHLNEGMKKVKEYMLRYRDQVQAKLLDLSSSIKQSMESPAKSDNW